MLGVRPLCVALYEQVKLDEARMKIFLKGGEKEDQKRVSSLPKVTHNYHVADRVLVLQPDIRPVSLRWESRVQDISPPENSQLHIISVKALPEISILTLRRSSTQRPASYSAGHPMPN